MTTESDVRYLLDRLAIQDVIAKYGLGQDLHQGDDEDQNILAQWAEVFSADAVIDATDVGQPPMNLQQYAELMRGKDLTGDGGLPVPFRLWQHREGYATVTIDGDTATATSTFMHTHETRDGAANVLHCGVWHDSLERRPEGWRITHRRLKSLFFHTFERIPNPALRLEALPEAKNTVSASLDAKQVKP